MAIINGILDEEEEETPQYEATEAPAEDIAEGEAPEGEPVKRGPSDAAKKAIKQLLAAATHIVYGPKFARKLVDSVKTAKNKEGVIAKMAFVVVMTIGKAAKGVPPKVIIKLSKPVVLMMFEVLSAARVLKPTPNMMYRVMRHLNEAFSRMVQQRKQQPPKAPQRPAQPQAGAPMPPGAGPMRPGAGPMRPIMGPQMGGGMIQQQLGR